MCTCESAWDGCCPCLLVSRSMLAMETLARLVMSLMLDRDRDDMGMLRRKYFNRLETWRRTIEDKTITC